MLQEKTSPPFIFYRLSHTTAFTTLDQRFNMMLINPISIIRTKLNVAVPKLHQFKAIYQAGRVATLLPATTTSQHESLTHKPPQTGRFHGKSQTNKQKTPPKYTKTYSKHTEKTIKKPFPYRNTQHSKKKI